MSDQISEKSGKCACGAVQFKVLAPDTYGACHCQMCRRWTGGVWMGVVCTKVLSIEGPVRSWESSRIGSRGSCRYCGSSLWHKPRHSEHYTFGQGLFDDQTGWYLRREIFSDEKPDHYALADKGQTALTGWGTLWAVILGRLPK
ncbi:glutathione-dependent formaldehyde-activating GFA [Ruegeria sp. TM1040]|uniref:GFA family protein n=1 Tax=Ruegeria sp. (strain TM1040) TaxID=292414 RepID=UPI0000D7CEF2|nr:GFA family protein [Ruegeria sp. TM1040]ABF63218.1 glutathione-dependent formaldehyde-activating GFA [Ruegeria sp. TM1040]MDF9304726.1 GFA family protein [Tritonibacter mobilis]